MDKILVEVEKEDAEREKNVCETEVKIGHYSAYNVYPTCGIATEKELIGVVDDPRYFAYPDRVDAGILWFTKGYIEYIVPNLLPVSTKIDQIVFLVEISSEAPGINNNWPSDISFLLNDVKIGTWTSPAEISGSGECGTCWGTDTVWEYFRQLWAGHPYEDFLQSVLMGEGDSKMRMKML